MAVPETLGSDAIAYAQVTAQAGVAELADAPGLGPGGLTPLGVRVPPPAQDPCPPARHGQPRELPEREHRLRDLAGRGIRDGGGRLLEDEQLRPGDLAGDRLAVADGEERVAAPVD